uniref:Uncharacterized protein n=1 Tax=Ficedula albicollis TaxID=59894 RepID=U3JTF0_FICAL
MPWLAVPYADEARRSRLNRLYGIQGIPTLIVLDSKGDVITRQGRVEVLNDIECHEFPWHPKPVLELTDSNAVQLNEGPCLVLFVDSEDDGESEAAKQLIQPIAEKIIAKYKAKEEEAPLLFFVAGERGRGCAGSATISTCPQFLELWMSRRLWGAGAAGRHDRLPAGLHQPARGRTPAHHPGHVSPGQVSLSPLVDSPACPHAQPSIQPPCGALFYAVNPSPQQTP